MDNKGKKSQDNKKVQNKIAKQNSENLCKQTIPDPTNEGSDEDPENQINAKFIPNFKFLELPKTAAFKRGSGKQSFVSFFKRNQSSKGSDDNPFVKNSFKLSKGWSKNVKGFKWPAYQYEANVEIDESLTNNLFPLFRPNGRNPFNKSNSSQEEYCSEIVDQLRQTTNTLVDEIRESRKEFNEKTAEKTKEIVGGLKELQTQITKALLEELPKIFKNNKQN
jgi:hypothetical protein